LQKSIGRILGWIIIAYLSVILLFCIVWFFPRSDKGYYIDYKQYDSKIEVQFKAIKEETEKYKNLYYTNKISKRQVIYRLERGADKLEKLYDSLKWKKGDEVTKELFSLKKLIIINYAQVYRNKAVSLHKETYYNEKLELDYITSIIDRFNTKDKLQKEKYNIEF
jgi:hypothetical protein